MGNRPDQLMLEAATRVHTPIDARELYLQLALPDPDQKTLQRAEHFLVNKLAVIEPSTCPLPSQMHDWSRWMMSNVEQTGIAYREYLRARKSGAGRSYFKNRAHALHFLQYVAPTKMVDGAWLYSTLQHWQKPTMHGLIRTYLEELGDGHPDKNHVVLYQQLLTSLGCEEWEDLPAHYFEQGAIQLALAYAPESMLPEIVGFNLGYEQLPLHLLVTAYELDELGIDPYYFTLHITVDNAASGHARKAVDTAMRLCAAADDPQEFIRRMQRGYLLNDIGLGTTDIISGFDLDREVENMLAAKGVIGKHMHSDYCRIGGRTVNDWLATGEIQGFLQALQQAGWIMRGQALQQSRFWQLIEGPRARMFGVFNEMEKQLLRDWIANGKQMEKAIPHRIRERQLSSSENMQTEEQNLSSIGGMNRTPYMQALLPWLSPARHASPEGLAATRAFSELLHG